jgi:hypothetical protein
MRSSFLAQGRVQPSFGGSNEHLKSTPVSWRFDKTVTTWEKGYHLPMPEIERVSRLLETHRIQPYIPVAIDQEKLIKRLIGEHQSIGALGVACVPRLTVFR